MRPHLPEALTPRERESLRQLSRGLSNKLIAHELDLTENAVQFHLKNIYRKLGVVGRGMAVLVSTKLELFD